MNWLKTNKKYWDSVASKYDSLYKDDWSKSENYFVQKKLINFVALKNLTILDLGCGTGIGYEFLKQNNVNYIGIDISPNMIDIINKKNYPKAITVITCMSDLGKIKSSTIDIVISLFTSFSYTDNFVNSINEIKRVLKPTGKIFISVLSRFSLRRILKFKYKKKERYQTRKIDKSNYALAHVFSRKEIARLFSSKGFTNIEVTGYNALWDIGFIKPCKMLWKFNLFISTFYPNLSHELLLTGQLKNEI